MIAGFVRMKHRSIVVEPPSANHHQCYKWAQVALYGSYGALWILLTRTWQCISILTRAHNQPRPWPPLTRSRDHVLCDTSFAYLLMCLLQSPLSLSFFFWVGVVITYKPTWDIISGITICRRIIQPQLFGRLWKDK